MPLEQARGAVVVSVVVVHDSGDETDADPETAQQHAAATIAHPGWPDPAANSASGSATSPTSAHRKPVHAAKPLSIIIELTLRQGRHSSSLSLSW